MLTGAQASKLFLDPAGAAAEGVTMSSSIGVVGDYLPDGPQKDAINELATAFQTKYGYPPPQFAQDGYSGVKLLVAAIEKAGGDGPGEGPRRAGGADPADAERHVHVLRHRPQWTEARTSSRSTRSRAARSCRPTGRRPSWPR